MGLLCIAFLVQMELLLKRNIHSIIDKHIILTEVVTIWGSKELHNYLRSN